MATTRQQPLLQQTLVEQHLIPAELLVELIPQPAPSPHLLPNLFLLPAELHRRQIRLLRDDNLGHISGQSSPHQQGLDRLPRRRLEIPGDRRWSGETAHDRPTRPVKAVRQPHHRRIIRPAGKAAPVNRWPGRAGQHRLCQILPNYSLRLEGQSCSATGSLTSFELCQLQFGAETEASLT